MRIRLVLALSLMLLPIFPQEFPHPRGNQYVVLRSHVLGDKVGIFADAWDEAQSPAIHATGNVEVVSETVLIQAEDLVVHVDTGAMDFKGETHLRRLPGKSN